MAVHARAQDVLRLRRGGGPLPVRAALLVAAACVGFAAMNAIIRHLGTTLDTEPLMVVFCRNLFAVLAMAAWFTALAVVPLADAVALSFTAPLFAAIAALALLREAAWGRRSSPSARVQAAGAEARGR